MDDLEKEIRDCTEANVAAGFDDFETIVEQATEYLADEHDEDGLRERVEQVVKTLFNEHFELQKGWPKVTDCDRLDRAFEKMEMDGIVARQNFSCCNNCGSAEIWDEIEVANEAVSVKGYVFYHMQDTESAARGTGLYLAYGAVEKSLEAAVGIGHEIQKFLTQEGLETTWDGTIQKRIFVKLDWQRRRDKEGWQ